MNKIFYTIYFVLGSLTSFSQDLYRTINGHVIITGKMYDSVLLAESHKLEINYDNKTKIITGKIFLKSIQTGDTYLDSLFAISNSAVNITGYIPVDFLTWDHKQYDLDVQLEISYNGISTNSLSKIKFTHTEKLTTYTCVMEAAFELNLSDFNLHVPDSLNHKIYVQFLQLILRQKGN